MTRTMGFARSVAAALVLTMFAGCATMGVRWYVARDFATTAYRTFDWDGSGQGATGDPRLDNNPFFHDRVRASVEKQLQAIGFERDQSGRAALG